MCQKAPGPRCSPHAYETMQKALIIVNKTDPDNQAAYATAQENLEESIKDYSSTPQGLEKIKELHKQARKNKDTTEVERLATLYKSSKQRVAHRKEGLKELEKAEQREQKILDSKSLILINESVDVLIEEYGKRTGNTPRRQYYNNVEKDLDSKMSSIIKQHKLLVKNYTKDILDGYIKSSYDGKNRNLEAIIDNQKEQYNIGALLVACEKIQKAIDSR